MTLKEKFEQYAKEEIWRTRNYNAEECEQIADEFAIGFAEWMTINYPNQRKLLLKQGNLMGFYTTKQLLEIYKTEKEL